MFQSDSFIADVPGGIQYCFGYMGISVGRVLEPRFLRANRDSFGPIAGYMGIFVGRVLEPRHVH